MKKLWNIYDNAGDVVYISNVRTHEVVYMNPQALRVFGHGSVEELRGKRCFEVLRRFEEPCPFCTEKIPASGEFYEHFYRNPRNGKSYAVKNILFEEEGQLFRLEIASEARRSSEETLCVETYRRNEILANECLRIALLADGPEESLWAVLEYLGRTLQSDRVYIFEENERGIIDNTYEWCAEGVSSERENLQNIPVWEVRRWYPQFGEGKNVLIGDLEEMREESPEAYQRLKRQNIRSLVVSPLRDGERVIGFYGADNPPERLICNISMVFHIIGHFIVSILKRRDLVRRLNSLSYFDQLTGVGNRYAMETDLEQAAVEKSLGLVYCDVMGLKTINDTKGHCEGDQLLMRACGIMREIMPEYRIYRCGGDEFLMICEGIEREAQEKAVEKLRLLQSEKNCLMAVGESWAPKGEKWIQDMLLSADRRMYEDKKRLYRLVERGTKQTGSLSGNAGIWPLGSHEARDWPELNESSFGCFLRRYYFDTEMFFRSVSVAETPLYVFFGDVQADMYFISDKLKRELGTGGNMVHDLFGKAEQFIYEPDREEYRKSVDKLFGEKQEFCRQRFRFIGENKSLRWVSCWGMVKWDEKRERPLFFSGCMTNLEDEYSADSVTGLLRYPAALRRLTALAESGERATVFGIALNRFSVVNDSIGRLKSDRLLRRLCTEFRERLRGFELFRMDGVRFLAVFRGTAPEQQTAEKIRSCILDVYRSMEIEIENPCTMGVLECPEDGRNGVELIERVMTCIYHAKRKPEQTSLRFSWEMLEKRQREVEMSMELFRNVKDNFRNFHVAAQPIIDEAAGRIKGCEILSRWICWDDFVPPDQFIRMLEESRQIFSFGKWVFEQAVLVCKRFLRVQPDFTVSFNVSYFQIVDSSFLPYMKSALQRHGVPARNMILELTETHFDEVPEYLQHLVKECTDMGMQLALDDFGKGYSTLQMLLRYPVGLVKLDREIVREITHSKTSRELVRSIVYACHRVDKKVCVEGVETEEELNTVRSMKADYVQGYYYCRPMRPEELLERVIKENREAGEKSRAGKD